MGSGSLDADDRSPSGRTGEAARLAGLRRGLAPAWRQARSLLGTSGIAAAGRHARSSSGLVAAISILLFLSLMFLWGLASMAGVASQAEATLRAAEATMTALATPLSALGARERAVAAVGTRAAATEGSLEATATSMAGVPPAATAAAEIAATAVAESRAAAAAGTRVAATAGALQARVATLAAIAPTATAEALTSSAARIAQATAAAVAWAETGARAEAVATAGALQATAVALAGVAATATVESRETAALRSAQATVVAMTRGMERVLSLEGGRLDHWGDLISSTTLVDGWFRQPVQLRNFIAAVRFHNPRGPEEGPWDYGLGFRASGTREGYRLYLDSAGDWHLELATQAGASPAANRLASGRVQNVDLSRNGSNRLYLAVEGPIGFLYVNGEYVATLSVSHRDEPGELWLGTGFLPDHRLEGGTTRYQDFKVLTLN